MVEGSREVNGGITFNASVIHYWACESLPRSVIGLQR